MERSEAIARSQRRYTTGRPCVNGHLAERDTLSGACVLCMRANTQRARERIREKLSAARG